jgi:3-dehydroquinate synthase class II
MLVTSEAQESQYISSRPFRVNAGAVGVPHMCDAPWCDVLIEYLQLAYI